MKKLILSISLTLLISVTVLFINGCKGKDGEQGPMGVSFYNPTSNTYVRTVNTWTYIAPNLSADINLGVAISNYILDKGAVLVYKVDTIANSSVLLPYTSYPSASYSQTWTSVISYGKVTITIANSDLTQPADPGSTKFKIVVIQTKMMLTNPHINFKDYEAVKKAFNLKE